MVRKQRIVVLCNNESAGESIANQIRTLFGDIFVVDSISVKDGLNLYILADLALSTTYTFTSKIVNSLAPNTDVYVVRRTIMRTGWEKVMRIPPKTKVFVAGDSEEAQIIAATLCELGVRHLEFVTARAQEDVVCSTEVAITTNDSNFIPSHICKVVNIGKHILDAYTLFDILGKMGQINKRTSQIIINNMNEIMPRSPGFLSMMSNLEGNRIYLEMLINATKDSLIAFNADQNIIVINRWAEKLFNVSSREWIGRNIKSILSKAEYKSIASEEEITDEIFNINGDYHIVNKRRIWEDGEMIGGVILFRKSTEIQRLERKVWQTNVKKGHIAKYHFQDIIGKSPKIQNCISLAKKMTAGDSGLLIQGESGTGKELFAQAIHNASARKDKPFIAFNCAALSDTLMASELFGYVEGAFTGAKRGGKAGLFETAHTGTIFLDEIGDISHDMQTGLLRVLQEKEIVRLGGTDIIPVDVRVIAATNQNLYQMVQQGKFRADLFYRLNIMILQIPTLRDRKEDIPYLVEYMLEKKGFKKDIPKDVMDIFYSYGWPGNVRELDNCLEYMLNISEGDLCVEDLPALIKSAMSVNEFFPDEKQEKESMAILLALRNKKQQGFNGAGRRKLGEIIRDYGPELTESEVRRNIRNLEKMGLLHINLGRSGTKISEKGEVFLRKNGYY